MTNYMRSEIIKALDYTNQIRERQYSGPKLEFGPGEVPAGDYSYLLTSEKKENLDKAEQYYHKLVACLKASSDFTHIYPGGTTFLELHWDDNPQEQVIIELSLYGPLAAVFVYGTIPEKYLQDVHSCLDSCGLVSLTKDEIGELEERGAYHSLF